MRNGCGVRLDRIAVREFRRSVSRAAGLLDNLGDLADAGAMLGRDRLRLAETERISFVNTGLGRAAFAFIGGEDHLLAGDPHELGEDLVGRDDPCPRIDHKQNEIGLGDGRFRLLAHARRSPVSPRAPRYR
jgi:hypothetical protein